MAGIGVGEQAVRHWLRVHELQPKLAVTRRRSHDHWLGGWNRCRPLWVANPIRLRRPVAARSLSWFRLQIRTAWVRLAMAVPRFRGPPRPPWLLAPLRGLALRVSHHRARRSLCISSARPTTSQSKRSINLRGDRVEAIARSPWYPHPTAKRGKHPAGQVAARHLDNRNFFSARSRLSPRAISMLLPDCRRIEVLKVSELMD
jgi:hypothetical protein